MKTIKKLLLAIIIALGLLTMNMVYAEEEMPKFDIELYSDDVGHLINQYVPFKYHNGIFFCIQYKAKFSATISVAEAVDGKMSPEEPICVEDVEKPWSGNKRSMGYVQEKQINMSNHQDAAYALSILQKKGISWESRIAQEILWQTSINNYNGEFVSSDKILDFNNSAEAVEDFKVWVQSEINDIQNLAISKNDQYSDDILHLDNLINEMKELKKLVWEGNTGESQEKLRYIIKRLREKLREIGRAHV